MKYAFAGDRQISCNILRKLINKGYRPSALLVTEGGGATHTQELIEISELAERLIFKGKNAIKKEENLNRLEELGLDYIFGIHYPYIIPSKLLTLPKLGFLNLHPAYLPYNKGWHTPSWAIMENTPYGATLHLMNEALDGGDIIHQKQLHVESYDTANTMYQRVLQLEEEVFMEALDDLVKLKLQNQIQTGKGTSHRKKDLEAIQEFNLGDQIEIGEFLNKLRGLTTNNPKELAYYKENGKKIGVKIEFVDLGE